MSRIKVKTEIRFNSYALLERAVEEGVTYGYNRAYKHTSEPSEETLKGEIADAVMLALREIIEFNEEE